MKHFPAEPGRKAHTVGELLQFHGKMLKQLSTGHVLDMKLIQHHIQEYTCLFIGIVEKANYIDANANC